MMNETIVVVVRAIIAFFSLLIFSRTLGKQTISQLTFFDYILGITIGSIAASLTTDLTSRAWPHWVGLFVWVFLVYTLQMIVLKSRNVSKYIDGEPTIIVMNGKILESAMKKLRYRASDLMEQLRGAGVFYLNEVEFAILETDGKLSVLKKSDYVPLTPKDMNIPTIYKGLSTEIIYEGKLIDENLKKIDQSKEWLDKQLYIRGFGSYAEVFLAVIDGAGNLFIDGYQDHINRKNDITNYKDIE